MDAVTVIEAGVDRLDDLAPLFLHLHDHHRSVSIVSLTEPDARAWAARRATYAACFADGSAVLHLTLDGTDAIGYAFTIIRPAGDDTFPLAPLAAELYSLAVAADRRGSGVGTRLLDAVDAAIAERGVTALTVAVMAANAAAIRLYERRGLVPGELVLYRFGPRLTADVVAGTRSRGATRARRADGHEPARHRQRPAAPRPTHTMTGHDHGAAHTGPTRTGGRGRATRPDRASAS